MNRIIQRNCKQERNCTKLDIWIAPSKYFIPIHWSVINKVAVLKPATAKEVDKIGAGSFAVHLFNSQTAKFKTIPNSSLYALLGQKHCPRVFSETGLNCSLCSTEYDLEN